MQTDLSSFDRFCVPGRIWVEEGNGGFPLLRLHGEAGDCSVYPYGAHVASFRPAGGEELLWMSPYSAFEEGKPIRGGIPLCFPWFGKHGSRTDLPLHGFARTRAWNLESTAILPDGRISAAFSLGDDESTRAVWPFRFSLMLTVTVGGKLKMELEVRNTGEFAFRYEEAFHTYFRVGDPSACEVRCLEGLEYIDRVRGDARAFQSGLAKFVGETVNAYMGAPAASEFVDHSGSRIVRVEQEGMDATVIWNPGAAAGGANPEIREAWNQFVCVESANCLDYPIALSPGESHRAIVRLSAASI
jgi:glucose-6-phosphate 1-epimerase